MPLIADEELSVETVQRRIKEKIDYRRQRYTALLELYQKHPEILDEYDSIRADLDNNAEEVKVLTRSLFPNGSPRGRMQVHDDSLVHVDCTVKYAADSVDVDALLERVPNASSFEGLIETSRTVNIKVFQRLLSKGELGDDARDLVVPGGYKTPTVIVRDKVPASSIAIVED